MKLSDKILLEQDLLNYSVLTLGNVCMEGVDIVSEANNNNNEPEDVTDYDDDDDRPVPIAIPVSHGGSVARKMYKHNKAVSKELVKKDAALNSTKTLNTILKGVSVGIGAIAAATVGGAIGAQSETVAKVGAGLGAATAAIATAAKAQDHYQYKKMKKQYSDYLDEQISLVDSKLSTVKGDKRSLIQLRTKLRNAQNKLVADD